MKAGLRVAVGSFATAVVALGLVLTGAQASQGAISCNVSYNQTAGGGIVSCSGISLTSQQRAWVTCHAAPGFTSWTKYTPWLSAGSRVISASTWPSCPWPATYSTNWSVR